MKMVDARRDHNPKFDLQMKGQIVLVDGQGRDMMMGWMNGVKIVLLGIVEVNAAVVVVEVVVDDVVQVVESAGVEVLEVAAAAVVVEVEVDEPLAFDMVEEEH